MPPNMLEALGTIEHLGEIARLFFIFSRMGKAQMEERAVIDGCKRTAGLATRYPRPKPAIALAISAGLLASVRGVLNVTERGRKFASKGSATSLDLSYDQGKLLLGALLDDSEVEANISKLFREFQSVRGQLVARKNSIEPTTTQLLFCRLLQQAGALTISGDYYVLRRSFGDLLAHVAIRKAKLTQEELLRQLERQRWRGEMAEQKVIEVERSRLVALHCTDLAAKVKRVSLDDVSAGYDIRSYEANGQMRLIEVKSSVGSQVQFEWSANERDRAAMEGDTYFVYFVPFSCSLPDLFAPIIIIRNPVSLIKSGVLNETPSGYTVREKPGLPKAHSHSPAAHTSWILFSSGSHSN